MFHNIDSGGRGGDILLTEILHDNVAKKEGMKNTCELLSINRPSSRCCILTHARADVIRFDRFFRFVLCACFASYVARPLPFVRIVLGRRSVYRWLASPGSSGCPARSSLYRIAGDTICFISHWAKTRQKRRQERSKDMMAQGHGKGKGPRT